MDESELARAVHYSNGIADIRGLECENNHRWAKKELILRGDSQ